MDFGNHDIILQIKEFSLELFSVIVWSFNSRKYSLRCNTFDIRLKARFNLKHQLQAVNIYYREDKLPLPRVQNILP